MPNVYSNENKSFINSIIRAIYYVIPQNNPTE